MSSKQEKLPDRSSPTSTPSPPVQTGSKRFGDSLIPQPDKSTKRLHRSSTPTIDRLIFPQNVAAPTFSTVLPPPRTRFENTAQLAYCNILLRKYFSPALAAETLVESLNPSERAFIDPFLKDEEEANRIRWLTTRIVEEFAADNLKSSSTIAEVLLLGPSLDQEYYRKLLNCMTTEFENTRLLDVDLLQGLIQLVQCASPDYLHPDDLVRILALLQARLQDTHQQAAKYTYYLTLALSRLLDIMVEGRVQNLSRVVDHELLSSLLSQLSESTDLYLQHQAIYALQALLHIPNDETRRQFVVRHAGNIAMGLLGVASVCKLDLGASPGRSVNLYDTIVDALEIGSRVVHGARSLLEGGQGLLAAMNGDTLFGGRQLWYSALREAQEHIRNGRLAEFNRLVFEAPCRRDVEFQWVVCQFLGEITVDPYWEMATRQQAVDFLVELYKNDSIRTQDEGVDKCILGLLCQVSALPEPAISGHAHLSLQGLENEGDAVKLELYRGCLTSVFNPYPVKVRMPSPESSTLLFRVLSIPDVEYDLHKLRQQRLDEHQQGVYIPLLAKPSLQAKDDALFPLMEKVQEFLSSHRQVLLLLGDSGAGKSTFNLKLEHLLWQDYKKYGPIPLRIILPTIKEPGQDLIGKWLRHLNFSEAQILEMKLHRHFVVICDGYDESQLKANLHTTNQWNQPGQWRVKVIICCRSQYLSKDYRILFQPQSGTHYDHTVTDLLQEAVIAPFSTIQIQQYVEEYVKGLSAHDPLQDRPSWSTEEYMDKLRRIPNLMDLVSNPFLLTLSLEALPAVVDSKMDLTSIRITRIQLYDTFVRRWLEANKLRLVGSQLREDVQKEFDLLVEDGFAYNGVRFQKDLAVAIFKEHGGNPIVHFNPLRDGQTWKAAFFSSDTQVKLLRESSTVMRSGNCFRFIHRSFLEYFYSRTVYDPLDCGTDETSDYRPSTADLRTGLGRMNIAGEPSIMQFLVERLDTDALFESQLFDAIEGSKADESVEAGVAAANAISILVRAGVRFNGADLRDIRIPGADLRGGFFDSADLEGANLSDVNLGKAWLRQANLDRTRMSGVQFGELPYIKQEDPVDRCVYSPDGKLLAVATSSKVVMYSTITWKRVCSYSVGGTIAISPDSRELAIGGSALGYKDSVQLIDMSSGEPRLVLSGHARDDGNFSLYEITCILYSPDGTLVATASEDKTARVWSAESGDSIHVLSHTEGVSCVAFSPSGLQLVSCGLDGMLRTWDTQTGESLAEWDGRNSYLYSVAYSPDGLQIASCGVERAVRLWDSRTLENCRVLSGHQDSVNGVAYSPDGRQMVSFSNDGTIRLWDPRTGDRCKVLSGHSEPVKSVAFSPIGGFIISGGEDATLRRWKAGGGLEGISSGGLVRASRHVDFSPCGNWVVTSNRDLFLRLWGSLTGNLEAILKGHTDGINEVIFSPCGRYIASASWDDTVRLWDARTGAALHVLKGHTDTVKCIAFSPSGLRVVSGSYDNTVRIWSTATGEPGFILTGHIESVLKVAFSPSGLQVASCSEDMTVRLWCSRTGQQQRILEHDTEVRHLVYSSGGEYLVSLQTSDGPQTPSCWDPRTGQSVGRLDGITVDVEYCAFSPDGRLVATVGQDRWLRVWGLVSSKWLDIRASEIGRTQEVKWMQRHDNTYLATITDKLLHIWKLVKRDNAYSLLLVWGIGLNALTMVEASMDRVVELSPVNLELVKQRGAKLADERYTRIN